MVFPTHNAGSKLTGWNQEGDVVASNVILCHMNNGVLKRRFSVVIGAVFAHVSRQLTDFNLLGEFSLQTAE